MSFEIKVKASPFVADIVALMPESTRHSLWRRFDDILDYVQRPMGVAPKSTIGLDAIQIGVKGITSGELTFKRQKDGDYALKASVVVGSQEKSVLRMQNDRADLLVDLPETVSNVKQVMPLRALVDYPLLDGFEIRRIDGKVLYLKGEEGTRDLTSLLRDAKVKTKEEAMSLQTFLAHIAETGQSQVDQVLMEFLQRLQSQGKLDIVWERIERALAIGAARVDITDQLYLEKGARLALRLNVGVDKTDAYGPYRHALGMSYMSDLLSYNDGSLRWSGSVRKNWGCYERHCFWRMPWRKNGQSYSKSNTWSKPIAPMLKAAEAGNRWWYH